MEIVNTLNVHLVNAFSVPCWSAEKNEIGFFSVFKMHNSTLYLYDKVLPP